MTSQASSLVGQQKSATSCMPIRCGSSSAVVDYGSEEGELVGEPPRLGLVELGRPIAVQAPELMELVGACEQQRPREEVLVDDVLTVNGCASLSALRAHLDDLAHLVALGVEPVGVLHDASVGGEIPARGAATPMVVA
jgi:hypothetical protein